MSAPVDRNGDRIVLGAYVRLPDGKHGWVSNVDDPACVRVTHERGGFHYFPAAKLVTTKPTGSAKSRKVIADLDRSVVSANAHRVRR